MRKIVPLFIALSLASPAVAQSWEAEVLRLHNAERAARGVAPLAWDMGLAAGADRWAVSLAATNAWGHSPRSWRPAQGENLWMGTTGAYPVRAMVGSWLGERRWFRAGIFPHVSTTGRWSDVGHYTQMIAPGTTRVGCAIRTNRSWSYLVCRYSPSGNVDGKAIY